MLQVKDTIDRPTFPTGVSTGRAILFPSIVKSVSFKTKPSFNVHIEEVDFTLGSFYVAKAVDDNMRVHHSLVFLKVGRL